MTEKERNQSSSNDKAIDRVNSISDQTKKMIDNINGLVEKRESLKNEIDDLESVNQTLIKANEDAKRPEEIASLAKAHINKTIEHRQKALKLNQTIANLWAGAAFILMIIGLGLFQDAFMQLDINESIWDKDMKFGTASFLLLKGAFFVSAFGAAISYCLVFRGKYASEAEKDDERLHTLSYGQFFLETYGHVADREEVKNALQGWHKIEQDSEVSDGKSIRTKFSDKQIAELSEIINSELGKKFDEI